MKERLDDADGSDCGIYLMEPGREVVCVFDKEIIDEDTPAVKFDNERRTIWVSVENVDALLDEMRRFEESDSPDEENEFVKPIRPGEANVGYRQEAESYLMCPACGESIGVSPPVYVFREPGYNTSDVYVHEDCGSLFRDALESIWDCGHLVNEVL